MITLKLVVGDWGREGSLNQVNVANAMGKYCQQHGPCHFVVSTGDNMYNFGVRDENDELFTKSFERVYNHTGLEGIRWYMSLGNHDYRQNPEAQIKYTKYSKRWYMPSYYYGESFVLDTDNVLRSTSRGLDDEDITDRDVQVGLKLIITDTSPLIEYYKTDEKMNQTAIARSNLQHQKNFIEEELSKAYEDEWKIIVGHHPFYSGGPHGDNKQVEEAFSDMYSEYKVHLSLSGHDHDYQRLVNPNHPTTFVVNGAGSKMDEQVTNHAYQKEIHTDPGFNVVRLNDNVMHVSFVGVDGNVISQFEINK
ncbi:tartrate-resistant acid phosphatase [Acrasis kona]|uniref:Tartrate-resistant acid phosphatase n=1 Tax=Acrasis kona TaxID=1008807 RepID=A0AAW2ZNY2_9EUKA